jgi:hypothetical protein
MKRIADAYRGRLGLRPEQATPIAFHGPKNQN